jgi:hypothetical protein
VSGPDPLAPLDEVALSTFAAIADQLIPAADGMPSAAEVVDADRLRFVLAARPDLGEPLTAALRQDLGSDVAARLHALADEPLTLWALLLGLFAGYYPYRDVRDRIGYPGLMAI